MANELLCGWWEGNGVGQWVAMLPSAELCWLVGHFTAQWGSSWSGSSQQRGLLVRGAAQSTGRRETLPSTRSITAAYPTRRRPHSGKSPWQRKRPAAAVRSSRSSRVPLRSVTRPSAPAPGATTTSGPEPTATARGGPALPNAVKLQKTTAGAAIPQLSSTSRPRIPVAVRSS